MYLALLFDLFDLHLLDLLKELLQNQYYYKINYLILLDFRLQSILKLTHYHRNLLHLLNHLYQDYLEHLEHLEILEYLVVR